MRRLLVATLLLAVCGVVSAGELAKGENEVAFSVSYSDVDFGTEAGFDYGSQEDIDLGLTYGWLLTDHHEVGGVLGYTSQDITGGDLGDLYDLQYSIEGAVKLYPWDHGGIVVNLTWATLTADQAGLPDADGISLGAGLLLKY